MRIPGSECRSSSSRASALQLSHILPIPSVLLVLRTPCTGLCMSLGLFHLQGCIRLPPFRRSFPYLDICLFFWYYPNAIRAFPKPEPSLLGDDGCIIPYWDSWWYCLWPPLIRCDFFKFRDNISLCVTCVWSCRHQMKGDANDLSIWVSSTRINELLTSVTLTSEIRAKVNKQLPLQRTYYERQVNAECHPRYLGCTITVDDNISYMKPIW